MKLAAIFPRLNSRVIQFFSEAAFVQKLLLKLAQLLVEEVIGLVDKADESVRGDLGRSLFDIGPILVLYTSFLTACAVG